MCAGTEARFRGAFTDAAASTTHAGRAGATPARGLGRGCEAASAWGSLLPALRSLPRQTGRRKPPPSCRCRFGPAARSPVAPTRWRGALARAAENEAASPRQRRCCRRGQPSPDMPAPVLAPTIASFRASRCRHSGNEMVVLMRQDMDVQATVAASPRIVETWRQQFVQGGFASFAPRPIRGEEARGAERPACGRISIGIDDGPCHRAALLQRAPRVAEPPELIDHTGSHRGGDEVAHHSLMRGLASEQCGRQHQSKRPTVKPLQQGSDGLRGRCGTPVRWRR
jgi:hypothetical protein